MVLASALEKPGTWVRVLACIRFFICSVASFLLFRPLGPLDVLAVFQLSDNSAISVQAKVLTYLDDFWNVLDMITIVLFTVGMSLRFIPNSATFSVARVVLSINLISFFFRILHIFSVKKELGPKLVMIRRMVCRDLLSRIFCILLSFVLAC